MTIKDIEGPSDPYAVLQSWYESKCAEADALRKENEWLRQEVAKLEAKLEGVKE